jgi:ankyrin repeat protein
MICFLYCAGYAFDGFINKAERKNQMETSWKEFAKRLSESIKIIDVNSQDGLDPLIQAVLRRDAAMIEKLLKAGANPNVKDMIGKTALMHAAY